MVNKNIQVVNQNGTAVVLSAGILVDYLKDYTSDWGIVSTAKTIQDIESQFAPVDISNPDKANIDLFNNKIGFVIPKITLNSLIDELVSIIKNQSEDYLTLFQSFNNLEKIAIYFILMTTDRAPSEILEMIKTNYRDLSTRDILIKLLSEKEIEETQIDISDPINGLYKLLTTARTHQSKSRPTFSIPTHTIPYHEYTFPMHNYNITKR